MKHVCEICGFETDNGRVMSNHKRWKHIYADKNSDKYKEYSNKISEKTIEHNGKRSILNREVNCPECGKIFIQKYFYNSKYGEKQNGIINKYCSKHCANKQGSKYVDYSKVSRWAKEHPTGFCSSEWRLIHPECQSKQMHSKRELDIVSYFKNNFPNDCWKQGLILGGHRIDGILLNPDLWSKKLKVVIEYDGIWHFKDICGQLAKKQKVDRITTKWCLENGYKIIRIDEDLHITNEQIKEAVYDNNDKLILFNSLRYDYLKL